MYRIGPFEQKLEVGDIISLPSSITAILGTNLGKFIREKCLILLCPENISRKCLNTPPTKCLVMLEDDVPKLEKSPTAKNSALTNAVFQRVKGRGTNMASIKNTRELEKILLQKRFAIGVNKRGTIKNIIAITKNRAESEGISLRQLEAWWGNSQQKTAFYQARK